MANVLLLDPSGVVPGVVMLALLRGELVAPPNTPSYVLYPNLILPPSNREAGRDALDLALHATTPPIIVHGHSYGAMAEYAWLRDIGPTSDIDPADVEFVCSGNPERKYNGIPHLSNLGYMVTGIPEDTPYTVTDFSRQYDTFSDWPDDTNNELALLNAGLTSWLSLGLGIITHMNYVNVGLDDPQNISYIEGNVTYLLSPTYPLPMLDPFGLWPWAVASQDRQLRPIIESAYSRPVTVDAPVEHSWASDINWNSVYPPASPFSTPKPVSPF